MCVYNAQAGTGWVCEHRWPTVRRMVQWRNSVGGSTPLSNIVTEGSRIAYSRGGK